jgi:hypothetical protein
MFSVTLHFLGTYIGRVNIPMPVLRTFKCCLTMKDDKQHVKAWMPHLQYGIASDP